MIKEISASLNVQITLTFNEVGTISMKIFVQNFFYLCVLYQKCKEFEIKGFF